ncbi:unnamed protein product [Cylicocyclus nassatus]|uniref:NR LBD domain-containing protein n=1 Tax=Cylicocyclus nassatus TaxID=53992 RepID=A0AA36H380_CYLNA|nr:unnamed protein product [Cylicocyclus nassatus]
MSDEPSTSSDNSLSRKIIENDNSPALPSEFTAVDEAEQLANLYMNLDRFCESTSVTPSDMTRADEDELISRMLDSTVKQLIEKTCPQCPRFTRNWKPTEFLDTYNFRRSWARDVVHMLDWANHFPAFKKLSPEDKEKVFIGRFTQFSLFTKCYRTYRESCSGLLLGCGNVFPYERDARVKIEDEYLRKLFSRLCDALFSEIIFPMAYLRITDCTYVLMKANIFLFEGFTYSSLTAEGKALIAHEKARHRAALLTHLNSGKVSFDDRLNQIIQIEHMMASIEAVSNFMDKEIQFLGVFGLLDMGRTLIRECHVNKYKFNLSM